MPGGASNSCCKNGIPVESWCWRCYGLANPRLRKMENSIFDLIIAPWKTGILQAAVRLNIFTVLGDKSMTAAELAAEVNAREYHLKSLLDALAGMGLVRREKGGYRNSQLGRIYFVRASYLRPLHGKSVVTF